MLISQCVLSRSGNPEGLLLQRILRDLGGDRYRERLQDKIYRHKTNPIALEKNFFQLSQIRTKLLSVRIFMGTLALNTLTTVVRDLIVPIDVGYVSLRNSD